MRIDDLLTEQRLDEGPIGQTVAKGVGGLAKGVGAVAGGIAGIPGAVKKGFKAGKAAVQGDPAADTQAAPATADQTQAAPADSGGGIISQFKKGFAKGRNPTAPADDQTAAPTTQTSASGLASAQPAADTQAAPAQQAAAPAQAQPAAPAADPAADKASKIGVGQINKIIPTLRTRDLMSLQANLEKTIASKKKAAPATQQEPVAATTQAAPAVKRNPNNPDDLGFGFDVDTGLPLKSQAEKDANKAKADAAAAAAGEQPTPAPKKRAAPKKKAAPSQAEIDADRARLMGTTTDSIIRTGNSLSETLARKVEEQKRKMFESSLANGTVSIYKK
jgi:hypothetical protein